MGVAPADCRIVARMVGIKTFINEFLAYEDLGRVRRNREKFLNLWAQGYTGNWTENGSNDLILSGTNITLVGGVISVSQVQYLLSLLLDVVDDHCALNALINRPVNKVQ